MARILPVTDYVFLITHRKRCVSQTSSRAFSHAVNPHCSSSNMRAGCKRCYPRLFLRWKKHPLSHSDPLPQRVEPLQLLCIGVTSLRRTGQKRMGGCLRGHFGCCVCEPRFAASASGQHGELSGFVTDDLGAGDAAREVTATNEEQGKRRPQSGD